jgi:hypothetical protein
MLKLFGLTNGLPYNINYYNGYYRQFTDEAVYIKPLMEKKEIYAGNRGCQRACLSPARYFGEKEH